MKVVTAYRQTPEQTSVPAYQQVAKLLARGACNAQMNASKRGSYRACAGHKKPGEARLKCRYCMCNKWHSITEVMLSEMLQAEGGT